MNWYRPPKQPPSFKVWDDWAVGFAEHPLQMIVCMMIGACIGVVLGRFIVTPWLDWLYATLHRLTGFAF